MRGRSRSEFGANKFELEKLALHDEIAGRFAALKTDPDSMVRASVIASMRDSPLAQPQPRDAKPATSTRQRHPVNHSPYRNELQSSSQHVPSSTALSRTTSPDRRQLNRPAIPNRTNTSPNRRNHSTTNDAANRSFARPRPATRDSVPSISGRSHPPALLPSGSAPARFIPTPMKDPARTPRRTKVPPRHSAPIPSTNRPRSFSVITENEFRLMKTVEERRSKLESLVSHHASILDKLQDRTETLVQKCESQIAEFVATFLNTIPTEIREHSKRFENRIVKESRRVEDEIQRLDNILDFLQNNLDAPVESLDALEQRKSRVLETVRLNSDVSFARFEGLDMNVEIPFQQMKECVKVDDIFSVAMNVTNLEDDQTHSMSFGSPKAKSRRKSLVHDANNISGIPTEEDDDNATVYSIQIHPKKSRKHQRGGSPIVKTHSGGRKSKSSHDVSLVCFTNEGDITRVDINTSNGDTDWRNVSFNENQELPVDVKYPALVCDPDVHTIYRFGGVVQGMQLKEVETYNWQSRKVSVLPEMNTPRQDACAVLIENAIYVLGGAGKVTKQTGDGRFTLFGQTAPQETKSWVFHDVVERFDTRKNKWKSDGVKPMLEDRYSFCAVQLADSEKIMALGGNTSGGRVDSIEVYDLDRNEWEYGPAMPHAKSKHCALCHGNVVYVAGGDYKSNSKSAFMLDLNKMKWEDLADMTEGRERAVMRVFDGRVCVFGDDGTLPSFEIHDKQSGKWVATDIRNHPVQVEFRGGVVVI